jgi:hypothetical protein
MKISIAQHGALCSAVLATQICMSTSVFAETPSATTPAATTPTAHVHALDRDGKPIYGCELMSETEISGLRSLLFSIKDPAVRDEARAAHRKAMDKRAAERGVKIEE